MVTTPSLDPEHVNIDELAFGDRHPGLAKSFDRQGMVLTCSSFSKDISPSLRVGWIATGRYSSRLGDLAAREAGYPQAA